MKSINSCPIRSPLFTYLIILNVLHISAFTIPSYRRPLAIPTLSLARDENNGENKRYRTREVGQSPAENELRQLKNQEDDYGYQYKYDDADYDYEEEEEEEEEEEDRDYSPRRRGRGRPPREEKETTGNFWNNPIGGMYADLQEERERPSSDERARSPRPRTVSSRSNMPRNRGSSRKTFRSGNPPPPAILKNFYDSLFWYGFDADETTSAADRTMFGGTRGKFSGLGLLADSLDRDSRSGQKRGRRNTAEYEDEDEDEDYEGNEDDNENGDVYYDDEYYDDEEIWDEDEERDDDYDDDYVPIKKMQTKGRERLISRRNAPSLPRMDDKNDSEEDDVNDEEIASEKRERRTPSRPRSRREPEQRTRRQARNGPTGKRKSAASKWFEEEDEESSGSSSSRLTRGRRKEESQTSPIINILDKVFQVDPDEVKYQAEDYNRRLGLDKKKRRELRSLKEDRSRSKPRKGYAYRYMENEEDDTVLGGMEEGSEFDTKSNSAKNDDNVIDVEARVQTVSPKSGILDDRQPKQQSWEDRASAYERVPPRGIKAWGPEGEIDGGIDARTYAARSAIEEIEKMRKIFEKKEELVAEAEQDLLQLKREASIQKKKLLSEDDRRYSSMIRDELRIINFDIEDSARKLRKAKGEALATIDKLEGIELRHWALLRQYEADQELEKGTKSDSAEDAPLDDGTSEAKSS